MAETTVCVMQKWFVRRKGSDFLMKIAWTFTSNAKRSLAMLISGLLKVKFKNIRFCSSQHFWLKSLASTNCKQLFVESLFIRLYLVTGHSWVETVNSSSLNLLTLSGRGIVLRSLSRIVSHKCITVPQLKNVTCTIISKTCDSNFCFIIESNTNSSLCYILFWKCSERTHTCCVSLTLFPVYYF